MLPAPCDASIGRSPPPLQRRLPPNNSDDGGEELFPRKWFVPMSGCAQSVRKRETVCVYKREKLVRVQEPVG